MKTKTGKDEIINILKQELKRHTEIIFAYIFGSFIQSENYNDIDIAIYIEKSNLTSDRWYEIDFGITLEKALGLQVDIIILNKAPDHLIHEVSKGIVILDRDEDKRIDFILPAWKRYFDFKIKREEFIKQTID